MNQTATIREVIGNDPGFRFQPIFARINDGRPVGGSEESESFDPKYVEHGEFRVIDVPELNRSEFTHFMDGTQDVKHILTYEFNPVLYAFTSAAVLARVDGKLQPPVNDYYQESRSLYGPASMPKALESVLHVVRLPETDKDTSISMSSKAMREIGKNREAQEICAACSFIDDGHGNLLVDGGIGRILARVGSVSNIVGVVKSHSKQYFQSRASKETMLKIVAGQRSSVFEREADDLQGQRAYSFYLKLQGGIKEDPMFGLIRVELAPTPESVGRADEIAAWLLHERAPLSMPDARYDKLLYPIHMVEEQLKSRQPSDAAIAMMVG